MAQKTRPQRTQVAVNGSSSTRASSNPPSYGDSAEPGLRNAILGALTRPNRSSLPMAGRLLIKFFVSYMIGHLIGDGIESALNQGLARAFNLKEGSSKRRRYIHLICQAGAVIIGNWLGNEISDVIDSYMSGGWHPRNLGVEIRKRRHALPDTAATVVRKFLPETLARRLVKSEPGNGPRAPGRTDTVGHKTGYAATSTSTASLRSRSSSIVVRQPGRTPRRDAPPVTVFRGGGGDRGGRRANSSVVMVSRRGNRRAMASAA